MYPGWRRTYYTLSSDTVPTAPSVSPCHRRTDSPEPHSIIERIMRGALHTLYNQQAASSPSSSCSNYRIEAYHLSSILVPSASSEHIEQHAPAQFEGFGGRSASAQCRSRHLWCPGRRLHCMTSVCQIISNDYVRVVPVAIRVGLLPSA